MRIYVAGPYTKGDVCVNVRTAIVTGNILRLMGHTPFVPHLTHFWHMVVPQEYDFWLKYDLEWLEVCDAILRIPGESSGADAEVNFARRLGLPVYFSIAEIPR